MRIAYVCADPGVPVFGRKGASIHVQEILRAFVRQGAAVELFAACLGGLPGPDLRAVRVRELAIPDTGDAAVREQARLAANNVFRLALAGAGPFDMVYERYALWSSAGMAYAREERVPGVLEVNAPLIDEQADYRVLIDRIGAKAVESRRRSPRMCDAWPAPASASTSCPTESIRTASIPPFHRRVRLQPSRSVSSGATDPGMTCLLSLRPSPGCVKTEVGTRAC